jgi:hypothetical protein
MLINVPSGIATLQTVSDAAPRSLQSIHDPCFFVITMDYQSTINMDYPHLKKTATNRR